MAGSVRAGPGRAAHQASDRLVMFAARLPPSPRRRNRLGGLAGERLVPPGWCTAPEQFARAAGALAAAETCAAGCVVSGNVGWAACCLEEFALSVCLLGVAERLAESRVSRIPIARSSERLRDVGCALAGCLLGSCGLCLQRCVLRVREGRGLSAGPRCGSRVPARTPRFWCRVHRDCSGPRPAAAADRSRCRSRGPPGDWPWQPGSRR